MKRFNNPIIIGGHDVGLSTVSQSDQIEPDEPIYLEQTQKSIYNRIANSCKNLLVIPDYNVRKNPTPINKNKLAKRRKKSKQARKSRKQNKR